MTQGGKREGAGRKPKDNKLVTKCFRVDEAIYTAAQIKHGKNLNKKLNEWLKRIAKQNPQ